MHMCGGVEDEEYSDVMVKEAIRNPNGITPIPGIIFSSNVSNIKIIWWALKEHWSYKDTNGDSINVEGHAKKLSEGMDASYQNSQIAFCIEALRNPNYQNDNIAADLMRKISHIIYTHGYADINVETHEVAEDHTFGEFIEFITTPANLLMIACVGLTCYAKYVDFYTDDQQ